MPKTTTNAARRHAIGVVCAALCAAASPFAWANDYPNKPVKLVVPYPPGGPTAYAGFLQAEVDKWGKVVKASGAKID